MQHYQIEISPTSKAQIDETFSYIFEQSPQNAKTWLARIYKKIDSLETMPHRCELIREHEAFTIDVREILFYSHRILFTVDEDKSMVLVHYLRHGAKDELKGHEF